MKAERVRHLDVLEKQRNSSVERLRKREDDMAKLEEERK